MKTFTKLTATGSSKNLLLLHGLFGSVSNWRAVEQEFRPTHRVFIPEIKLLENDRGTDSLQQSTTALYGYFVEKGIEKATLLGNSLGGHIALLFALNYPEKVDTLVLTGSSGLFENSFGGSFPRLKDYNYIKDRVEYTFYDKNIATPEMIKSVYKRVQNHSKALSILSLARSAQRNNLANQLHKINAKTLLIWGLQDKITPVKTAYEFYEKLPSSKLHIINKCGHVPMLEQPAIFNQFLKQFLGD